MQLLLQLICCDVSLDGIALEITDQLHNSAWQAHDEVLPATFLQSTTGAIHLSIDQFFKEAGDVMRNPMSCIGGMHHTMLQP